MAGDGALQCIEQGRRGLLERDYWWCVTGISRCQQIIAELIASLDPKHAPDLCERLTGLYTFMITRLMTASHERDPAIVPEVIKLLQFERETWVMLLDKLADEVAAAGTMTRTPDLGPGRSAGSDAPGAPGLIGRRVSYQG